MTAEVEAPKLKDRARTVYVWWGVGLGLLLLLGLICWTVVAPVIEVRKADKRIMDRIEALSASYTEDAMWALVREEVHHLGGPAAAARKIGVYLRMPTWLAVGDHSLSFHRDGALLALGECGEDGVGPLLRTIRGERGNAAGADAPCYCVLDQRIGAIQALGRAGSRRGVSILVELLGDPNVGHLAAKSLGRIGDPGCVDAVIAELQKGHEQAVPALKLLKDPRGPGPLLPLLADGDKTIRKRAAEVLAVHGPEAVEPLMAGLDDPAACVRLQAAKSLGTIGDARAVEPLLVMLRRGTDDAMLRKERESMERPLRRTPDGSLTDPWAPEDAAEERATAAEALGRIGDRRAIEPLAVAARDPHGCVRLEATVALWAIRTPGDSAALSASLAEVCRSAARSELSPQDAWRMQVTWHKLLADDRPEVSAAVSELPRPDQVREEHGIE
ncbi:MAG TPA: HEAT repeat domain-containing protein [Planctomycetota bacterium]|nr:HEAT repeat domain-containing protein [Planctomycetota bacterium]